jgi:hypothetical protein
MDVVYSLLISTMMAHIPNNQFPALEKYRKSLPSSLTDPTEVCDAYRCAAREGNLAARLAGPSSERNKGPEALEICRGSRVG